MQHTINAQLSRRDFAGVGFTAAAACMMSAIAPCRAHAATESTLNALSSAQSEYEAAMAELQSITEQLETAQYNLSKCQADLQSTNDQIAELETSIAQKQAELLEAQEVLAERVGANYKAGNTSLMEVLLDSTDFEDFVSRLYYANKVTDSDAQAIENVKTLKSELETQESELQAQRESQEQLLAEQQEYTDQLASTESYYESYTASLSSEVTALMAQAQQETAAEQAAAAAEAARKAQEQSSNADSNTDGGNNGSTDNSSDGNSNSDGNSDNGSNGDSNNGGSSDNNNNNNNSDGNDSGNNNSDNNNGYNGGGNHVSSVASIAWNYCGVPYVWGGSDPSGFDCSGLTQYCYAQAGYSIGRDTYAQAANVSSCGQMVYSMSQLEAGDLIFPHSGHVGIYQGGGYLIDAPYEGQVVQYRSCWFSDCFGGCPV